MAVRKVGVVGTGNVGVAGAYAMFMQGTCSELVLVDLDIKRARGEALDLMHGQAFTGRITVKAGGYEELAGAQVVVVTAGVGQKPGETRLDLLNNNARVFRHIARDLDKHAPDACVVVASNPVDILTWMMQELSERPQEKIMGTGTMLDTSRFRSLLGEYYNVDPRSVHGYVLGEHGDSEFAAWSTVSIGGKSPVRSTILGRKWDEEAMEQLFVRVRDAAYEIIEGKGYTNLAIGLVISRLVAHLMQDRRSIQPVSVRLDEKYGMPGLCISVPALVCVNGVDRLIHLNLTEGERTALERSGAILKEQIDTIDLSPASG
jgi:L-lactate dehydrogenase